MVGAGRLDAGKETPQWQGEWRESFRDLRGLLEFLNLDPRHAPENLLWNPEFPLRVPRPMLIMAMKAPIGHPSSTRPVEEACPIWPSTI
jgi:hypothetical protein